MTKDLLRSVANTLTFSQVQHGCDYGCMTQFQLRERFQSESCTSGFLVHRWHCSFLRACLLLHFFYAIFVLRYKSGKKFWEKD